MPRIGKYNRDGSPNPMPGHDITMVLIGCFILAFGWFGFNPGSTLGASGAGNLRIGSIAVNTMLAGATGSFGSILYMWIRYGKPDASMTGNGLLAGLVAITAPSGFVNTVGAAIIGFAAGMLVCLSVEFVERVMKVDDPVGAISVHGTCGLWGVIVDRSVRRRHQQLRWQLERRRRLGQRALSTATPASSSPSSSAALPWSVSSSRSRICSTGWSTESSVSAWVPRANWKASTCPRWARWAILSSSW